MKRAVITKIEFSEINRPKDLPRLFMLNISANQTDGLVIQHDKTECFSIPVESESDIFLCEPQQIKAIFEEAIKVLDGMTA
jgi:hypothetical protein